MRPFASTYGWDSVLDRLKETFLKPETRPATWSMYVSGLILQTGLGAVRLTVTANLQVEIHLQAVEEGHWKPMGSWQRIGEETWISKRWGAATSKEMVNSVEARCKEVLWMPDET